MSTSPRRLGLVTDQAAGLSDHAAGPAGLSAALADGTSALMTDGDLPGTALETAAAEYGAQGPVTA